MLDKMPQRDVKSLSALVSHFAKQNQHREAIECFLRMLRLHISPKEDTLGTAIHSSIALKDLHLGKQIQSYAKKVCLDSNFFVGSVVLDLYVKLGSSIDDSLKAFRDIKEPNVFSYSSLLRAFTKEGKLAEAGEVFRKMPERNVVAWNTMISGYAQSGENEEAMNLFIEMFRRGVRPTQSTYPCAIIAAANIGSLGLGRSVHACALKFLHEPNLFLSNSLISFYAKCGCMEDSRLAFAKMGERNVVSWNALICGFAQNGHGKEAIETYERMKKTKGLSPNSVTLLCLLSACSHSGLVDKGYEYFNEARRRNDDSTLLQSEHYACMIDLLSRSGRFLEAEKFLKDLPFDPGVGFWKALLGGCLVHSNVEMGEVASRKIMELGPGDVSSYVMLSNAHSAAGRWESVLDVRQKIKEKGLSWTPGCSWIEIGSKIHVFVKGDERHSDKDEIYMVLRLFIDHVMDSQDAHQLIEY